MMHAHINAANIVRQKISSNDIAFNAFDPPLGSDIDLKISLIECVKFQAKDEARGKT